MLHNLAFDLKIDVLSLYYNKFWSHRHIIILYLLRILSSDSNYANATLNTALSTHILLLYTFIVIVNSF